MHGAREQHDAESETLCDCIDPSRIAQNVIARDPNGRTSEMTTKKGARLCGRGTCESKQENGRTAERGQKEDRDRRPGKMQCEANADSRAENAVEQTDQWATVHAVAIAKLAFLSRRSPSMSHDLSRCPIDRIDCCIACRGNVKTTVRINIR